MIEEIDFKQFIHSSPNTKEEFNFISLFSSAGIADYGLKMAGGKCLAACEIDPNRREVHKANFDCPVFNNIKEDKNNIISLFQILLVRVLAQLTQLEGKCKIIVMLKKILETLYF